MAGTLCPVSSSLSTLYPARECLARSQFQQLSSRATYGGWRPRGITFPLSLRVGKQRTALHIAAQYSDGDIFGMDELADGSLLFTFGSDEDSAPYKTSVPRPPTTSHPTQSSPDLLELKSLNDDHTSSSASLPPRPPSAFKKKVPITRPSKRYEAVSAALPATSVSPNLPPATSTPSFSLPTRPPSNFVKKLAITRPSTPAVHPESLAEAQTVPQPSAITLPPRPSSSFLKPSCVSSFAKPLRPPPQAEQGLQSEVDEIKDSVSLPLSPPIPSEPTPGLPPRHPSAFWKRTLSPSKPLRATSRHDQTQSALSATPQEPTTAFSENDVALTKPSSEVGAQEGSLPLAPATEKVEEVPWSGSVAGQVNDVGKDAEEEEAIGEGEEDVVQKPTRPASRFVRARFESKVLRKGPPEPQTSLRTANGVAVDLGPAVRGTWELREERVVVEEGNVMGSAVAVPAGVLVDDEEEDVWEEEWEEQGLGQLRVDGGVEEIAADEEEATAESRRYAFEEKVEEEKVEEEEVEEEEGEGEVEEEMVEDASAKLADGIVRMRLSDLKDLAKTLGLKGYSKYNKVTLQAAVIAHLEKA